MDGSVLYVLQRVFVSNSWPEHLTHDLLIGLLVTIKMINSHDGSRNFANNFIKFDNTLVI